MIDRSWYDDYMARYTKALATDVYDLSIAFRDLALETKANGGKMMFAGNGASAAISSHGAGDFTKQGGVPSITFHDPDLFTMMANDYGYENWVAKSIEALHGPNDVAVLISSSGTSKNIVNAATRAKELGLKVVTFSGFNDENPLCKIGDINFVLESRAYNIIENTHMIWIATVIDMIVGQAEYSVS